MMPREGWPGSIASGNTRLARMVSEEMNFMQKLKKLFSQAGHTTVHVVCAVIAIAAGVLILAGIGRTDVEAGVGLIAAGIGLLV